MIELVLATAIAWVSVGVVIGRYLATGGRCLEPEREGELEVAPPQPPQLPASPYREQPRRIPQAMPVPDEQTETFGPAPSLDEAIERAVTAEPSMLRPKPAPLLMLQHLGIEPTHEELTRKTIGGVRVREIVEAGIPLDAARWLHQAGARARSGALPVRNPTQATKAVRS